MAIWGRLTGAISGLAVGGAASAAVNPVLEVPKQEAWKKEPNRILDLGTLAHLIAQGLLDEQDAVDEANRNGYRDNRLRALVQLNVRAPDVAEAIDLRRRGHITEAQLEHAIDKAQLEEQYRDAVSHLYDERLAPAQIALGIVRSLLEDPGFLPVSLDTKGGKVPAYGVSPIDPVAEAETWGIEKERLRVMVGEIGLPMALEAAAGAVFRGIIRRPDFNRAVLEGDTRPEWADAIFEQSRAIPSPSDYVNAHIRGWITEAEMYAGTARHGMSADDTHLLYLRTGRPAAPGQMATAAARGIDGPDGRPMDRAQFLKGIAESDIRPEWGPMLWESRFLYPPLFQISRLVEAGEITPEKGAEWLVKDRYPPDVVATIKAAWEKPTASTKQTHVQKAQTQLWTATHRAYMAGEATEQEARGMLTHAGVPDAQVDAVIGVWGNELQLVRKQLTATQLRKAWKNVLTNPGTGKPWTRDEVVARLEAMGYSAADAVTFIEEV